MRPVRLLLLLALIRPGPSLGSAQTLSLGQAFAMADSQAFANRIARSSVRLRASERDQALKGILPSFRAEGGWTRTTDPLNAFGFALRQRGVTQASFDPSRLNSPDPISNVGAGLVAEVPLLNPDAWLGRRAGAAAVRAAEAMAEWTRATTRLAVVQAYFGGVLRREQVQALEAGWAAARSHVRLAGALQVQGLVTRSDVLLAEVRAGELEARLLAARGEAALALRELGLVLGRADTAGLSLPENLPEADRLPAFDSAAPVMTRADVAAARAGAEAARRDVARSTALLLPRINSFGRVDWNQPDRLFRGRPGWTVGVMASWSLFGGGSELVSRQILLARAQSAETEAEAAEATFALELAARRNELEVALASARIATRAVEQAVEAHRIVTRKYEGGLATVTELLESAAVETGSRVGRAAAMYRAIVAAAQWRIALGADGSDLTVLDRGGN